eukprot:g6490.t1
MLKTDHRSNTTKLKSEHSLEIERMKMSFESELKQMQAEVLRLNEKVDKDAKSKETYRKKLEEYEMKYIEEKEKLKGVIENHKNDLELQRMKHQMALETCIHEKERKDIHHEEFLSSLKMEHEKNVTIEQRNFDVERRKSEEYLSSLKMEHEKNMTIEQRNFDVERRKSEEFLSSLKMEHEKNMTIEQRNFDVERRKSEEYIVNLRNEHEHDLLQHQSIIDEERMKSEGLIFNLKAEHQNNLKVEKAKHQSLLLQVKNEHENALDQHKKHLKKVKTEHRKVMERNNKKGEIDVPFGLAAGFLFGNVLSIGIGAVERECDNSEKKENENFEFFDSVEIEENEERYASLENANLSERYENEINELTQQHIKVLEKEKEVWNQLHDEKIQEKTDKHNLYVNDLVDQHRNRINSMSTEIMVMKKKIYEEQRNRLAISTLHTLFEKEIENLSTNILSKLAKKTEQLNRLSDNVRDCEYHLSVKKELSTPALSLSIVEETKAEETEVIPTKLESAQQSMGWLLKESEWLSRKQWRYFKPFLSKDLGWLLLWYLPSEEDEQKLKRNDMNILEPPNLDYEEALARGNALLVASVKSFDTLSFEIVGRKIKKRRNEKWDAIKKKKDQRWKLFCPTEEIKLYWIDALQQIM